MLPEYPDPVQHVAGVPEELPAVLATLESLSAPVDPASGEPRPIGSYGVRAADLHRLARQIGRDHALALGLWDSGIHAARLLAALVDEPKRVTQAQMEAWVAAIDTWDLCDGCCCYLFDRTPWSYAKAVEWAARPEEFVKRAGFALMAYLAVHDKKADDRIFAAFLPLIAREATDSRHFVKNAVNWALRQIGKRNLALNEQAITTAREIHALDSSTARWVAADALRELTGSAVQERLRRRTPSPWG